MADQPCSLGPFATEHFQKQFCQQLGERWVIHVFIHQNDLQVILGIDFGFEGLHTALNAVTTGILLSHPYRSFPTAHPNSMSVSPGHRPQPSWARTNTVSLAYCFRHVFADPVDLIRTP